MYVYMVMIASVGPIKYLLLVIGLSAHNLTCRSISLWKHINKDRG